MTAESSQPEQPAAKPAPAETRETVAAPATRHHADPDPRGRRLALLTLTALGIVYGDIGTSPLYAFRECFKPEYGLRPTAENVYGVLSLIVWALILVVSWKYVAFILRADNKREGGIFALLALILRKQHTEQGRRRRGTFIVLGLIGASLLLGEAVITPAISVLGAVEGIGVAAPALERFIVPITVVILFLLFVFQHHGTERVGRIFGPVMLLWFAVIAVLGVLEIVHEPQILAAVNPLYAVRFAATHGLFFFTILGTVVLVVTGAEALYADMGHFGKRPIRAAWFVAVLPALLLNYFGQGALVLRDPAAAENPFYLLAPEPLLVPLIGLATAATIVASQALISGSFSLVQQAVQLGFSPRMTIVHTSSHAAGQIYIPEINRVLMIGTLLVVLYFQNASALSGAYGIAVTGTMTITSILFFVVARGWGWSVLKAGALVTGFLLIDLSFFGANLAKIVHGGWVPVVLAVALFTLFSTWKRGRQMITDHMTAQSLPIDLFLDDVRRKKPYRVKGTAVFMTSDKEGAPVVLLHHLKHNKVLHEQVVLLSISVAEVPEVQNADKVVITRLGEGFYRIIATFGFMETPDVRWILSRAEKADIRARPAETTYYLGRERLIPTGRAAMFRWRKKLFVFMSRNARSATEFFGIPPNRVVEMGAQIEL